MTKVLIVEDESLLAEELKDRLLELDATIEVVGELSSVSETIAWFEENHCDLVFLDIHLNDGLSFSIFDHITIPCPIVFTTAYDQYAIKAFDVNSIAYLLKPFGDEELKQALEKYAIWQEQHPNLKEILAQIEQKEPAYLERVTLSIGKLQKPFTINDIAYFMADDRFVFAITQTGKKYFYSEALYQLEEKLNPKHFFRLNRSFIASYSSISELLTHTKGRLIVQLKPEVEQQVIVSSEKAKELKEWLQN